MHVKFFFDVIDLKFWILQLNHYSHSFTVLAEHLWVEALPNLKPCMWELKLSHVEAFPHRLFSANCELLSCDPRSRTLNSWRSVTHASLEAVDVLDCWNNIISTQRERKTASSELVKGGQEPPSSFHDCTLPVLDSDDPKCHASTRTAFAYWNC